jgi:hypothetical protein
MAMSHAGHTHPSTPAARSACRKAMANGALHMAAEPQGPMTMAERIAYVVANPEKAVASANAKTEAWIMSEGTDAARDRLKLTGPVARRMARQAARADMKGAARTAGRDAQIVAKLRATPARPQPRRSGARVSTANSTCVQAALHIDAHGGRCACGWCAEVAV